MSTNSSPRHPNIADHGPAVGSPRRLGRRRASGPLTALGGLLLLVAGCVTMSDRKVERCEGIGFAVSCGNGTCDNGETEQTCPGDCVPAKVVSYNNQSVCDRVQALVEPSTTAEVQAAVRRAREQDLPIRVIGRRHSSNEQLCNTGIIVSTARLTAPLYLEWFEDVETVVTEPGIRYGDLTQWLEERGRSFGFAVLGTRDPTIAGAIATGSHGSSPNHPSVISSLVESVEVVDAQGEVWEYTRRDTPAETWKALTAGLGLVGIMTKVRLRVEPAFNLDVQVTVHRDDRVGLGRGPIDYVKECDYGQLIWFPGQRRVVKMCGIKTDLPAELGATNRLLKPDFSSIITGPAERALHYGSCNPSFNCRLLERTRYRQFVTEPPLYRKMAEGEKDRSFSQVVGRGSRMMSSELTLAQQGILQHDFELAVPPSRAAAAFAAAREYFAVQDVCLPLVGVFTRFSRVEDEAWIAHTSASELFTEGDYVTFFEMPIYVPDGVSSATMDAFMAKYEEWVRRLIEDFGARPHWGKNDSWVFDLQDPIAAYGERWSTFRRAVARLDPDGVFSNAWSNDRGLTAGER